MFENFNIEKVPDEVAFNDIQDPERMEERFFTVIQFYGDIVGMNENSVEFCPNHKPPKFQTEVLPWLWLIYPQEGDEILKIADNQLKKLIGKYYEM